MSWINFENIWKKFQFSRGFWKERGGIDEIIASIDTPGLNLGGEGGHLPPLSLSKY